MKKRILSAIITAILTANSISAFTNAEATDVITDHGLYQSTKDFDFKIHYDGSKNGYVQIIKYKGTSPDVIIPSAIAGRPVKSIYYDIFQNKKDYIQTLTIPEGVEEIWYGSFAGCSNLKTVTLPSTLKEIDRGTFRLCEKLETVNIPNGVSIIRMQAFEFCTSLKSVNIPGSVKTIEDEAFYSCDNLKYLTIGNGVETIGINAFADTAIETLALPPSITSIEDSFSSCEKLRKIETTSNSGQYRAVDNTLCFYYNTKVYRNQKDDYRYNLVLYPSARTDSIYIIPDYIVEFEDSAFHNSNLKALYIPKTIKKMYVSSYAGYRDCSNLTDIYYEGSREDWVALGGDEKIRIEYEDEFGNDAWLRPTIHFNASKDSISETSKSTIKIDANDDNKFTALDIAYYVDRYYQNTPYSREYDLNKDGKFNALDIAEIVDIYYMIT